VFIIKIAEEKWFIVKIKPNSYQLASQNLERQGIETFLPKIELTKRKKIILLLRTLMFFLDISLCVLIYP
jgi:hypothetical protein